MQELNLNGFSLDENGSYVHKFGDRFEVALERYGATEWLFAFYQDGMLRFPKHRAFIHGRMLLIAGKPLNEERAAEQ